MWTDLPFSLCRQSFSYILYPYLSHFIILFNSEAHPEVKTDKQLQIVYFC